jgi:hypothetical protein
MPPSPISTLAEAAISTFELFRAYVDAGFTPDQALGLVAAIATAHMRGGATGGTGGTDDAGGTGGTG